MSSNEEYALRIANGESLSAILDEARKFAYDDGWADAQILAANAESVRGDDQNE